jgi:DNA (cytosine-5)-methyltransferase 1
VEIYPDKACIDLTTNSPDIVDICSCIRARYDAGIGKRSLERTGVIERLKDRKIKIKELGFMDNGTGKHQSNTVYDEKGICPNITTIQGGGDVSPGLTVSGVDGLHKIESPYRIRKLTPLECWRLMGFTDEEFRRAEKVNANTQLYKQAGNSIVVDVLENIFKQIDEVMEVEE